jgi:hypothetical protein
MLLGAFRPQTTTEDKKSQPPTGAEGSAVSINPATNAAVRKMTANEIPRAEKTMEFKFVG